MGGNNRDVCGLLTIWFQAGSDIIQRPPGDRQTPVIALPCPKLRLREVKKVFTYPTSACPRGFHNWHERRCYEYNGSTFPARRSQWYYGRDKQCPDWSGASNYLVEFSIVAEMENVTKGFLGMYEIKIILCLRVFSPGSFP